MSRFEGGRPPERLMTIPDAVQKNLDDCVRAFVRLRNGSDNFLTEDPAAHAILYHLGKFKPDHPFRALLSKKLAREGLTIAELEQAYYKQMKEHADINKLLAEEPKKAHYKKIADTLIARKKTFEAMFLQHAYQAEARSSDIQNAVLIAKSLPDHPFSLWLRATFLDPLRTPEGRKKLEENFYAHHKVDADIESALSAGSDTRTYLTEQKKRDELARSNTLKAMQSIIGVFHNQKILSPDNDKEVFDYVRKNRLSAIEFAIALAKPAHERDRAIEAIKTIDTRHAVAIYDELPWDLGTKEPTMADFVKKLKENLDIFKKVLLQAGLSPDSFPFEDLVPAWINAHYAYDEPGKAIEQYKTEIRRNIEVMTDVERAEPGACAALYQEFGIKAFGRYPAEALIEQYRRRNEDIPYGLVMYPRADGNGAFYQNTNVLKKVYEDARKEGVALRIMEAERASDIPIGLIAMNVRYGYIPGDDEEKKRAKNLLSFAILGGHGTPGSVQVGRPEAGEGSWLTIQDIGKPEAAVAKQFFEDGASGVLFSCSTGQGFAPVLSVRLDMPFIGPAQDSYPTGVTVKKNSNKKGLTLIPTYESDPGKPVAAVGIEQLTTD